ncbi:MAG: hypothetical protein EZS28_017837 [Streblomastix strix]|uniref:Uncharacterized protein n=1 Tax=Streblomastix strix TaxID=222440 RepID=A0A5J4VWC0_9EUKA|nr:MAG: hypothetical protein EZS28_017837 [Streblomastix strix]
MFFALLLTVVLSLGANTPLQSTQSVPTISAQLHIDHIFQTALPLNQSSNLPCRSFVSQTLPKSYHSVSEALAIPCTHDEGYEIILLDSEHTEYLKIDQNSSIIIRNAYTTQTIWQIDKMNGEIIQLITVMYGQKQIHVKGSGICSMRVQLMLLMIPLYRVQYKKHKYVEGSFNIMNFRDNLSDGAIAGIVIGSLAFAALVVVVIIFLIVLDKKKSQSQYSSLDYTNKFLRSRKEKEYI